VIALPSESPVMAVGFGKWTLGCGNWEMARLKISRFVLKVKLTKLDQIWERQNTIIGALSYRSVLGL